jgi:hypothetical protein
MSEEPPFFDEASRRLEERLGSLLGENVEISVHLSLDGKLIDEIIKIESSMFRDELRYSLWELMAKSEKPGFTLIMVRQGREPLAFFFGYEDSELPGGYYGDTLASVIEGKGVGSSLFALVHIYCYESGYSHFTCHTEEVDERGRKLRDWYLTMGMDYIETTHEYGDLMRVRLTPEHVNWMHHRHILGEKQYKRSPDQ